MTHKNPKTDRAVAISVLSDVLETGAFANIALRKTFDETTLDPRARAFVTDLVNETLRNVLHIDHLLNKLSKTPVDKMKPFIRNLLRVSVCQIYFMEKIPDRAAVNEAVVLAKAYGFHNLTGYVNGVLRNVAREKEKAQPPATLALTYSYPNWLIKKLVAWLGEAEAEKFCANSHMPPPVIVLANTHKTTGEELAKTFAAEEIDATPLEGKHPFFVLRKTGDMTRLDSFNKGMFYVVDPGIMHAVEAMNPKPGQTIMDLCAAPGGKTFAMACAMGNQGSILAYDIHPHRVELIRQTRKRLGLDIISAAVSDALSPKAHLEGTADAVLLDVPCSGFGTIRKHPEIKYNRQPQDIPQLVSTQRAILAAGAKYVKIGGRLVYCTCTIGHEENQDNIQDFLSQHPHYTLLEAKQILPGATTDGFYIATLERNA